MGNGPDQTWPSRCPAFMPQSSCHSEPFSNAIWESDLNSAEIWHATVSMAAPPVPTSFHLHIFSPTRLTAKSHVPDICLKKPIFSFAITPSE